MVARFSFRVVCDNGLQGETKTQPSQLAKIFIAQFSLSQSTSSVTARFRAKIMHQFERRPQNAKGISIKLVAGSQLAAKTNGKV